MRIFIVLIEPHSAANHADGNSLHQIELHQIQIRIAQNKPFCAGRLEIDLDARVRALTFAIKDDALAKLRMPNPLPKSDTKLVASRRFDAAPGWRAHRS